MAKRFVDTSRHRQAWRKLDPKLRAAFYWLQENCDAAGYWTIDLEHFKFECGYALDIDRLVKETGAVEKHGADALRMVDFIEVNYGALREGYNPHKPALRVIAHRQISSLKQASTKLEEEEEDKGEDEDNSGKEQARAPKGPNLEVSAVVDHLTAALKSAGIAQSLDGSVKDNRWAAQSLLQKLAKDYPGHDALESAKALINAAVKDPFHGRNATSVRYLFNNCGKIAASFKANGNATAKGSPVTPDEAARATAEYFDRKRAGQPVNG